MGKKCVQWRYHVKYAEQSLSLIFTCIAQCCSLVAGRYNQWWAQDPIRGGSHGKVGPLPIFRILKIHNFKKTALVSPFLFASFYL